MPPVAFGTLAMIPVLDDESISTSPHIFLDSANSSIATFQTKASTTPHPFLSYANRGSQLLQSTDPLHVPSYGQRQRGNSTPHLFLNYSDNSGRKGSGLSSGRSGDSLVGSLGEFELQCDLFLQSMQVIPRDRAAGIAKAFRLAAGEVVAGQIEPCGSDVFAVYLHQAFGQKQGASDDTDRISGHMHDDESVNRMKGEIERQSQEIQFLRSALKHLVLPSHQESTSSKVTVHKRSDRHVHLPDVPEEESPYLPVVGVPRSISIPLHPEDSTSHLDLDLGLRCDLPEERVELFKPKQLVQDPSDTVKKAMEVLHKAKLSAHQSEESFTNMEKGQIHGNRARGISCSVYFQSWGLSVRGQYNGTVKDGIPHGRGVLRFDNRDYYAGEFLHGELHGEGSLFLRRDGRWLSFRGEFVNNKFMGPKRCTQTLDDMSDIL
eukprot:Nitzschia sp. Nitz4//scaffold55_size114948//84531//85832//NITZ4_003915-RA/size114948-processed-gene-0.77-mRNA-1//-1//CDS//3329554572//8154//frame0